MNMVAPRPIDFRDYAAYVNALVERRLALDAAREMLKRRLHFLGIASTFHDAACALWRGESFGFVDGSDAQLFGLDHLYMSELHDRFSANRQECAFFYALLASIARDKARP